MRLFLTLFFVINQTKSDFIEKKRKHSCFLEKEKQEEFHQRSFTLELENTQFYLFCVHFIYIGSKMPGQKGKNEKVKMWWN